MQAEWISPLPRCRHPVRHPHVRLPGCAAAATSDLSFGSRRPGVNLTRDGSATEMEMAEHPREIINLLHEEVVLARFPRKTPATFKVLGTDMCLPPISDVYFSSHSFTCFCFLDELLAFLLVRGIAVLRLMGVLLRIW